MTGRDDEFDDFLSRRRPLFGRTPDDNGLEPPAELDRIVLRQAREAIEADRPPQVYRGPRWGAPLAIAATLVLAFTVVFQMMPAKQGAPQTSPEVAMKQASRELDDSANAAAAERSTMENATATDHGDGDGDGDSAIVVDLAEPVLSNEAKGRADEARRARGQTTTDAPLVAAAPAPASKAEVTSYAAPPPAAAPTPAVASRLSRGEGPSTSAAGKRETSAAAQIAPAGEPAPEWRHDEESWLAKIGELRAAGDTARADAEFAEYKRQHRAYAVAPDR